MRVRLGFPIERRELRVASRRPATYFQRLLTPAAVLAFALLFLGGKLQRVNQQEMGREVFAATAWIAWFYAVLSGFTLTSDCLSKEKRENTLGLLFLTRLRSYDIVLAKLLAHSLVALSGLVAALPLLMIPMLSGGLSLKDVGQTAATLLVALLLSLATGLLTSSLFRNGRLATALAFALLVFLSISGFVLITMGSSLASPPWEHASETMGQALLAASPLAAMIQASPHLGSSRLPMLAWPMQVMVQLGLTTMMILAASYFTQRHWQERSGPRFSLAQRLRYWLLFGPAWYRRHLRQRWFAQDPLAWLIIRPWYKKVVIWSVVGIPAGCFASLLWLEGGYVKEGFVWLAWFSLGLFKIALALESSQGLASEIRQEELEALLGTPLSAADYLASHWRALRALFAKPLLALLLLLLTMLLCSGAVSVWKFPRLQAADQIKLWLVYGGLWFIFLLDCWALGWVGLWQGLISRRQLNSGLHTMILVLGSPYILTSLLFFTLLELAQISPQRLLYGQFAYALLFILSVFASVVLGLISRQQVKQNFRALALQHRSGAMPLAWWKRLIFVCSKARLSPT